MKETHDNESTRIMRSEESIVQIKTTTCIINTLFSTATENESAAILTYLKKKPTKK